MPQGCGMEADFGSAMKLIQIVCVCVLLAPCVAWSQAKHEEAAPATVANVAALSLVKPGSEPRAPIRFAPTVGSVYTIRLSISMSAGVEVNGARLPAAHTPDVTVVFRAKALETVKSGGTRFEVEFADSQVVIRTGATHEMMDATRDYFEALKGTKTKFIILPTGEIAGFKFQTPANSNWMVRLLGKSILDAFHIMICWVPEEAVGQGAAWKVIVPGVMEGEPHSFYLDHEWAITEKESPHIRVNISSAWQASGSRTPKAAGSLEWQSMKSSGYARYALSTPSPFPTEFESKLITDGKASVVIKADKGAETAKVNATINMRGTVRVEKPATLPKPKG